VADNLPEVLKAIDTFVDKLITKLSMDIVAILAGPSQSGGTPVDTGWARSNWIPSIGNEFTKRVGSKQSVSFGDQISGTQKLLSYTRDKGTVFISNNVPYIGILNSPETTSLKAQPGFVQAAIIRAITELSK